MDWRYKAIVLLVFLFGITIAESKDSFSDIYSKNVQARGGAEVAKSLNTFIYGGELIRGDSLTFHFRIAYKLPNKMIVEYYYGEDTIAVGYDGITAWTLMPKFGYQAVELPVSAINEATTLTINPILKFYNRLDQYANKSKIKISDMDILDSIPQYTMICRDNQNDTEETISVNQTDFLVSTVKTMVNVSKKNLPATVKLADYRMIDSAMIPFHVKIFGEKASIVEVKLSYIELNPKLEDIIFEMPK